MGVEISPTSKDCPPKVPEDTITVEGMCARASDAKKKDDLSSGETNREDQQDQA